MFNKKYCLISIFDTSIFIKDFDENLISLAEYVKKYYYRLYKLEDARIGILYSDNPLLSMTVIQKSQLSSIECKQKKLAEEKKIPMFILAICDGKKIYEIVTKQTMYVYYSEAIAVRQCSKEEFMKKFNSEYETYVHNFFNRKNFRLMTSNGQKVLKRD